MTPDAMPIAQALEHSESLKKLQHLLRESQARFEILRTVVPQTLCAHIRPGPIDATHWCLFVDNTAIASKLRQLQPLIETAFKTRGWQPLSIRMKVKAA
jgi:hypothetical protein